ncbi:MAG: alginate export family protein [Asticcacaulis sp.]
MYLRVSASLLALAAASSAHADTFSEALGKSKILLDSRLRTESVSQAGLKDAEALTWRNRVGFETGTFGQVKLLVEFDDVRALTDDYNSGYNGKTAYAGVGDPEVTELNRLQLTWTPNKATTVTAGRQRILIDDNRFVGNSGWRQDEMTFDALRLDVKKDKWSATYAYIGQVNRTAGEYADWDSDSHIATVAYTHTPAFKVQGFVYALDFDNAAYNSSLTTGLRLSGEKPLSKTTKLTYAAVVAQQKDYGNNPADFSLKAWNGEAGLNRGAWTVKAAYEVNEGNGVRGFITPIGSAHNIRGWADAFSTNGNKMLPDGLNDLSLTAGYTHPKALGVLKKPSLTVVWHDFRTDRHARDVGTEWDAIVSTPLTKNLTASVKYADFERADTTMPASRTKVWVSLEYKL